MFADRIMIEQVVLNLVKNGIESMQQTQADERVLSVTARLDDGSMVEVAVADRGCGMTAEQAERIFVPFYTTKSEGMGMGLNICRSIIEYHDGHLWVQPNPQGGSVFRFTLPIRSECEAPQSSPDLAPRAGEGSGERVTGAES